MSSNTDPIQTFPPVTAADMAQHTEQALVELIYVGTGNQMLGSALANLESALNTTQSVLNILQNLQNLHNQISVKSKSAFSFDYKFGPSGIHHNPSAALTAGPARSGQHISVRFNNANVSISVPPREDNTIQPTSKAILPIIRGPTIAQPAPTLAKRSTRSSSLQAPQPRDIINFCRP